MSLDATVGGPNANSYVTEANATAYLTGSRLSTVKWQALTVPDRERALIWATTILDASMAWNGKKKDVSSNQSLRWPRYGAYNRDGYWLDYNTIPTLLIQATSEMANALVEKDRTKEPGLLGKGLSSLDVGSIKLVADRSQILSLIPPYILTLLIPLGEIDAVSSTGMREVRLNRV